MEAKLHEAKKLGTSGGHRGVGQEKGVSKGECTAEDEGKHSLCDSLQCELCSQYP